MRLTDTPVGLDYEVDVPLSRSDVLELCERGELRSSFAFLAYQDDVSFEGQQAIRHLISVKLVDCAPTSNPVYSETDCGLRSFAERYDTTIEEVRSLASRNELYLLDDQANRTYIDMASTPTPLDVARRNYEPSDEFMRMQTATARRKVSMDAEAAAPSIDLLRRRLANRRKRMDMEDRGEFVEVRSLVGDVDRFGLPARRDSAGHAID